MAAVAGLLAVAALLIYRDRLDVTNRLLKGTVPLPTSCPDWKRNTLDPNAYLPQALHPTDLSGYTLMVDIPGAPVRRHPCGLIAERTQAFVRNDAVTGPGRAEVDAFARELGYPITAQPLFPIQGAFVSDHRGVFDVQSQTTAFLSEADARNYADHLWVAAQGSKWTTIALAGMDARAGGAVMGEAPNQDWYATAIWRSGVMVVHLDADGTRADVEDMLRQYIPIVRSNLAEGLLHGSPPPTYSYGH